MEYENGISEDNTLAEGSDQEFIRGEVNCKKLNLRETASKESKIERILQEGEILTIEDEIDDWFLVRLEDGTKGFVMQEYVRL